MKLSEAWLKQAREDFKVASYLLDREDPVTYCQVIAKCQQSVEKYVKGVVEVLVEVRAVSNPPKEKGHILDLSFKILTIRMKSSSGRRNGLSSGLNNVLHVHYVSEAQELCNLSPVYPEQGKPFVKNTEYPFNLQDGSWTAPCEIGVFSFNDVDRFYRVAQHFDTNVPRFVKSVSVSNLAI